jgi:YfiH family protein
VELLEAGLPAGVVGCFTTRAGGVSPPPWDSLNLATHVEDDLERVTGNAMRVITRLGVEGLSLPQQVHGARVVAVESSAAGLRVIPGGADALVTNRDRVAIGVLAADCMPVLLADPEAGVVAAAHAGRPGLTAGVLEATLDAMSEMGAEPGRIHAVVGPSICGRCYEVPAEMCDEVEAVAPGSASTTRTGTPALDLPAGAFGVLTRAGVADMVNTGICTAEDARFFSYRRDGLTGRFAGIVMLAGHD